ncbi:MAG: dihydropteroate synthase [Chloroflexota bacterium]
MSHPAITKCGNMEFHWGERTYVMGILNLSPDSFSGDGIADPPAAIVQAQRMVAEGADVIDIGGETTRPGSAPISADEEIERIVPVIRKLASIISVPISVDTSKYEVAYQAVEAGAVMLNDQWGLRRDSRLAELAAARGLPLILMSNQREKGGYDARYKADTSNYNNVMPEMTQYLRESIDLALKMKVPEDNLIIDPGIGFGKNWEQNLEIIQRLSELKSLGRPILIGTSRKSFIGRVLDLPAEQRVEGTAATIAIAIAHGADMVRVHDVLPMVKVCRMSDAIVRRSYGEAISKVI